MTKRRTKAVLRNKLLSQTQNKILVVTLKVKFATEAWMDISLGLSGDARRQK